MHYRVLIFDNDTTELNPLKILLKAKGYEIRSYPDPASCPLISDKHLTSNGISLPADFIISNVTSPLHSNLELIEDLKRKNFKIKNVAILSGDFREEEINKVVEMGCRVFPKPVSLSTVLSWLDDREKNIPGDRKLLKY